MLPPLPAPPPPFACPSAPDGAPLLCPRWDRQARPCTPLPVSLALYEARLRDGSPFTAAEACVSIRTCLRVGPGPGVPHRDGVPTGAFADGAAAVAALVPLLVRVMATGGIVASYACMALSQLSALGTSERQRRAPAATVAAFLGAGGVEAAVALLDAPLRQPGLWKLHSLRQAADEAVRMLTDFAFDPAIKVPLDDD